MDRRQFVATAAAGLTLSRVGGTPGRRPNVVVVLSDDQGWGDLSINGNTDLQTPHIDSLGRDGAVLDRFYVCPLCAPTRAEFLTGRYHSRGGVRGVSTGQERLNLDERTIADAFRAAGYATGCFGKWHNGSQYPYHPNGRGFDEYYGFTSGHWGHYFNPALEHNGRPVQGKGYIADDLTDHALAFIEANRSRPFFCYLPYNTPHSPFQVPDRWWNRFKDRQLGLRYGGDLNAARCALAMCENLDWNVGRVLAKLAELDLADGTIVLYFGDNGPNGPRWNGGMRGTKGSTDEGGTRVPCLIRWPGAIPAGQRIEPIAGAIDLLPTLASLAAVSLPADRPLDGISLAPLLRGTAATQADRRLFAHQAGKVSVRTQRWRLDAQGRLYDMLADPSQTHDVAAEQPQVAAELRDAVAAWQADVLKSAGNDDRPYPVGHAAFPTTPLPARDGVPHGGVKRSASAPNCSFFTDWTTTDGYLTWDVEVASAGDYEAVVHYTCPAGGVGATLELSLNGAAVQGNVTEPFDPPLQGAAEDRVPRKGESYVKDFKPLTLGTLKLPKGRGLLTLKALAAPAGRVADVRAVTLRLL
jgi:arylsulfatase A-like enzyme